MNLEVKVDMGKVSANIGELVPKAQKALEIVGQTTGAKMKSYAQNNAKWTDRTGAARGGLAVSYTHLTLPTNVNV